MARAGAMVLADLVRIGLALGVEVAERMYLALREEPRDARGDPIDWTIIEAQILTQRSAR